MRKVAVDDVRVGDWIWVVPGHAEPCADIARYDAFWLVVEKDDEEGLFLHHPSAMYDRGEGPRLKDTASNSLYRISRVELDVLRAEGI